MRSVFAISAAVALFATSAFAAQNADFNPVNFAAEEEVAATPLSEAFTTFRWKGEESLAKESFELNVEDVARIQVTDYKNRGDMFEVFDNGVSIGLTTKVDDNKDEEVFAATPEEALKDDRFSKGVFDLAKGEHKITIKAVGPYEAGTAAIRVLDHSNVAFHKKKDDKDDDDEDDDDDDDEDDDDKDHDDHDDDHDDKEDDDEDDGDYDYHKKKGGKDWHKEWHKEIVPPGGNLDLSHTLTITRTKWVIHKSTHVPTPTGHHHHHHHKDYHHKDHHHEDHHHEDNHHDGYNKYHHYKGKGDYGY